MKSTANILTFKKSAENWEFRLPLGNGRLGLMQKGHAAFESLQLNEESIWSGGPMNRMSGDVYQNLDAIRNLVNEGRIEEAQELAFRAITSGPVNMRAYQTAGDFNIEFFREDQDRITGPFSSHPFDENSVSGYQMFLDLENAVSTVEFDRDEVHFTRKAFVSAVQDMIFLYMEASKPGSLNFRGGFDRGIWCDSIKSEDGMIFMEDAHGVPFVCGASIFAEGGEWGTIGTNIYGKKCDRALVAVSIRAFDKIDEMADSVSYGEHKMTQWGTNTWKSKCKKELEELTRLIEKGSLSEKVSELLEKHCEDHKKYYNRMKLELGSEKASDLSTPDLLAAVKNDSTLLFQQYLNFSRYLLIASSRKPGRLPANLQGIWNCAMDPPWGSKYTININLEMNYWPACLTGLSDCEESVFRLLARSYEKGVHAASSMYNCRGYVLHHNTDIWGDSAPQDAWIPATFWNLGAAWLATHIWENFSYTGDKSLLKRYYYLIHEACQFFVDYLVPSDHKACDGEPYLIINPSVSPENTYRSKIGQIGAFSAGCEMDNQILRHLFESALSARNVLGASAVSKKGKEYDESDFRMFRYVLDHLARPRLNSDGSIMEWAEEAEEVEKGHRHISHLYGLFPGHTITLDGTPDLARAAEKTLENRLSNGGGHTGWSQAWILNFWASLRKGDKALEGFTKLLGHSTLPNLLDTHPPFQIDGNFGTLSAILRLLCDSEIVSSENGIAFETGSCAAVKVHLLPALPSEKAWQQGKISGICLRGGLILSMEWKDGKVTDYKLDNPLGVKVVVTGV